ncbi:MAG TPA: glycoside hydrolase family 9 protein, partial [Verrucomicrobiae bacterium]|nr:glycoside hydrolase family 9 protein [Verrucomicrobiae bacterium]
MSKGNLFSIIVPFLVGLSSCQSIQAGQAITDANPMRLPQVGDYQLREITPTLLELTLINTGATAGDASSITNWNFVSNNSFTAPAVSDLTVTVNGAAATVSSVGFKRRPLYAPLNEYDLRIGNYLYLQLSSVIPDNATVAVTNPRGNLWSAAAQYQLTADPLRITPAIHVNQEGYMPGYAKQAQVGYYAGNLGEVIVSARTFNLVNASNNQVAYTGSLVVRKDVGYETSKFNPIPYQNVLEADFTSFNTPGEYRLQVPGLGASYPFMIDSGVAALFARTYELGLFHQRCGFSNELPYSRFHKDACHTAPAIIPSANDAGVNASLAALTGGAAGSVSSIGACLFPYVKTGQVDVHGGHHDAGDYSKYTIDVAQLCHNLQFAVDSLPGVSTLDNLGIPESGDGIPDVLQEAKWEIDFLARMQDSDGGFYFLVYPHNRQYEADVSLLAPNLGDTQVVFPKTTAATAAAVGALAEAGSSPTMKKFFPADAANYLAEAKAGWQFLQAAFAKYGRDNCYQMINQYGDAFGHDDEMAWAAAALYAATGDTTYQTDLMSNYDPSDASKIYWSWWRMYDAYGCAIRDYAFAARSGRLQASQLNAAYLAKCEQQIVLCGDDNV